MKNYEGGHAKNVANFGMIIIEVTQMGAQYNPANPALAIAALQAKDTEFKAAMVDVNDAIMPYKTAVNAREQSYDDMSNLAIRIKGALGSSGASPEFIKDVKGIINKIVGRRTGKKKEPDPNNPDGESKSTSQMSYDNRKANFELLITLLKGEPKYKPNEKELKIPDLESYIAGLTPLNIAVNTTLSALNSVRAERDALFYGPELSMSDIATKVKMYTKSVLGATNPTYKRIAGIRIKRPGK